MITTRNNIDIEETIVTDSIITITSKKNRRGVTMYWKQFYSGGAKFPITKKEFEESKGIGLDNKNFIHESKSSFRNEEYSLMYYN